jgi:hypothetical protein
LTFNLWFEHFAPMRLFTVPIGLTLLFFTCILHPHPARANSEIYPATPSAENAITWKDGYFYISGKPTFLTSGEMHYAHIPRERTRPLG